MIKLILFKDLNLLIELSSSVVPPIGSVLNTSRGKYRVESIAEYGFSYQGKLIEVDLQVTRVGKDLEVV